MNCQGCDYVQLKAYGQMLRGSTQGLGAFNPIDINSAITHARDLWNDILEIFGIHAGQREADVIVPLQNEITQKVLVQIADMNAHPENYTCADYVQAKANTLAAESQFMTFLKSTEWKDGRAALQAEWWLTGTTGTSGQEPYFRIIKDDFLEAMEEKGCTGGGGGIITNPDGTTNWPLIALAGGAAYLLLMKK